MLVSDEMRISKATQGRCVVALDESGRGRQINHGARIYQFNGPLLPEALRLLEANDMPPPLNGEACYARLWWRVNLPDHHPASRCL